MTKTVEELAPMILEKVKSARHILLHLHPSPDPDSVGSGLAMKLALEQLGKKVTLVAGDSLTPEGFAHFPGYASIVKKTFSEIDFNTADAPDLFIAQDAGSLDMVSRKTLDGKMLTFPTSLEVIVIDHHISNTKYGTMNLVDATYAATCQILADIFTLWNVMITHDIALNLIIGMYTDTGGFKHPSTTPELLSTVAQLARIAPDYTQTIFVMENNNHPGMLKFQGMGLSSISLHLDGKLAIAAIPFSQLGPEMAAGNIRLEDTSTHTISSLLKSVVGWDVGVCMVELELGKVKMSFRTRDPQKFDLSVIAGRVGGGGHRAAAGANMLGTMDEAVVKVVESVRQSM